MRQPSPNGRAFRVLGPMALLLLAISASAARAQRIQGIVLDKFSHSPVPSADVRLLGAKGHLAGRIVTGTDGRFALTIPHFGAYSIRAEALGYAAYTTSVFVVDTAQQVSAEVDLAPAPIALQGLEVTTTAVRRELDKVGFFKRKARGFGYFVTEKDLREKTVTRITDAFYGIPGVHVMRTDPNSNQDWDVTMAGAENQFFFGGPCFPSVSIDGTIVRHGGRGGSAQFGSKAGDHNVGGWYQLVDPADVAGIEVYPTAAGAPPQVQGGESPCGAILIWTKEYALRRGR